jgi:hypothetical protein
MRIDKVNQKIYIRQSWLGDMTICPERARLGQIRPEFRTGSDATIIGTALHAGIESVLDGRSSEVADMLEVVNNEYETLEHTNYKKTNIDPDKIPAYLESMSLAFYDGILPHVEQGGKVEHKFSSSLGFTINGYAVYVEGTMDYVSPSGVIWDWKTASRQYNIKEKQKSNIQASVYADACVSLGLSPNYPVDFRFGVMVRQEKPKSQIVSIVRTEAHGQWLRQYIRGAVNTAMNNGYENNWIMNDSSALCSESWCSYWSICKGAFVRNADDSFPEQLDV